MPSTYTPSRALNLLAARYPAITHDAMGVQACDDALAEMWSAYFWRKSLADLPPFYLVGLQQDYGPPTSAIPSDFLRLHEAWCVDVVGNIKYPLHVRENLVKTTYSQVPEAISYEPEVGKFRLSNSPPLGMVAPQWQIEGTYQKVATKITGANLGSFVLPWDDTFFRVYRQTVKWKFLELSGSPEANEAMTKAIMMIRQMIQREGGAPGANVISPNQQLAMGISYQGW